MADYIQFPIVELPALDAMMSAIVETTLANPVKSQRREILDRASENYYLSRIDYDAANRQAEWDMWERSESYFKPKVAAGRGYSRAPERRKVTVKQTAVPLMPSPAPVAQPVNNYGKRQYYGRKGYYRRSANPPAPKALVEVPANIPQLGDKVQITGGKKSVGAVGIVSWINLDKYAPGYCLGIQIGTVRVFTNAVNVTILEVKGMVTA